jgi:hypothetical protein
MENFSFHGLGCCPMESFVLCCHRLDCCLMDVYMYILILCHRLDCRLMEVSFPMDLVVVLWVISGLMDFAVVL